MLATENANYIVNILFCVNIYNFVCVYVYFVKARKSSEFSWKVIKLEIKVYALKLKNCSKKRGISEKC